VHVISQHMAGRRWTPLTTCDSSADGALWDDVAELAAAVLTCGAPTGFERRRLPVAGRRASAYARLEPGGAGQVATLVVVIAPEEDVPANARELRRRFGLTRRESEVALMLADRRSNREIAETLSIAERTARRHTEQVLSKLNTSSRTEVGGVLAGTGRGREIPA